MRILKVIIHKVLNRFGYQILKKSERGWNPIYLSSLSDASVVLDIGAGRGTSILYKAFKNRKFVLFEPLPEYKEELELWKKKINCKIEFIALGDIDGEIPMHIDPKRKTMSSMVERSNLTKAEQEGEIRKVKISKLDSIIGNYIGEDEKLVIKIDVEGYELNVLKGARDSLKKTEIVIVETSIAELYKSEFSLLDLLRFMDENGFQLFDILYLAYYKNWKGLMWADLVFIPKGKNNHYPN